MAVPDRPLEGVVAQAQPADAFVGAPPQSAPAADLGGWAREFVLFTPALLYTHGGLDRDVVQEYVNEAAGDVPVARFECPRPVFSGMNPPGLMLFTGVGGWDHTLLATPRECWEGGLRRHLATAEILDRARGRYFRALPFSLVVADPGVQTPRDPVPTVEVVVVGLDGNTCQVLVEPARVLGRDVPAVAVRPPRPETLARGLRMLAGERPAEAPDAATVATFQALAAEPPPT